MALAAGSAAAVAAFAAPGAADAAGFTSPQCGGAPVGGSGGTFIVNAMNAWRGTQLFRNDSFSPPDSCGSGGPQVSYTGIGSGPGRASVGSHEKDKPAGGGTAVNNNLGQRDFGATLAPDSRWSTSDTAANATQRSQIEAGLATTTADDALLHEIPATAGAITVDVNFPTGCTVPDDSPQKDGTDNTNHTGRFWVPNAQIEKAFVADPGAGGVTTWGQLLGTNGTKSNIVATANDGGDETLNPSGTAAQQANSACAATRIVRVVRDASSGTTDQFKNWLNDPGVKGTDTTDWTTLQGSNSTTWPNPGTCTGTCGTNETDYLKRGNGNAGVAQKVAANAGSIAYTDLADARLNGMDKDRRPSATDDIDSAAGADSTFWLRIAAGSGSSPANLVEPAFSYLSTANGGPTPTFGSNCAGVTYKDRNTGTLPPAVGGDRTLSNWDQVVGVNSPYAANAYGICTLTYFLAFDDNANAFNASNGFPDTVGEEARARTEYDFINAALGNAGQSIAQQADYSLLPATIRDAARVGAAAIGWNKSGTAGGGGGGTTTPPPAPASTNNTATGGGTPATVSSLFTVTSARSDKLGVITMPVDLPGAGALQAIGTTSIPPSKPRKKATKIGYGKTAMFTSAAGKVTLRIKPSAAAKATLAKGKTLKVLVKITYTPKGGTARSSSRTVVVKGVKKKH